MPSALIPAAEVLIVGNMISYFGACLSPFSNTDTPLVLISAVVMPLQSVSRYGAPVLVLYEYRYQYTIKAPLEIPNALAGVDSLQCFARWDAFDHSGVCMYR